MSEIKVNLYIFLSIFSRECLLPRGFKSRITHIISPNMGEDLGFGCEVININVKQTKRALSN